MISFYKDKIRQYEKIISIYQDYLLCAAVEVNNHTNFLISIAAANVKS